MLLFKVTYKGIQTVGCKLIKKIKYGKGSKNGFIIWKRRVLTMYDQKHVCNLGLRIVSKSTGIIQKQPHHCWYLA